MAWYGTARRMAWHGVAVLRCTASFGTHINLCSNAALPLSVLPMDSIQVTCTLSRLGADTADPILHTLVPKKCALIDKVHGNSIHVPEKALVLQG